MKLMEVRVEEDKWCCGSMHCEVDGTDVTQDCIAANEEEGWAELYEMQSNGRPVLTENRQPKIKRLFGKVVLTLRDNASEEARREFELRRQ